MKSAKIHGKSWILELHEFNTIALLELEEYVKYIAAYQIHVIQP